MSRYIPMPAYPDRMPVDISFVFEDEKPAGKRGFVRAVGEDLCFEDGTLARFWGVNVNGGACFPDKKYAAECARRLAQAGCNIIRFHQMDAEWDTPNLFGYTKGKRVKTTRVLDERSLDALDYFVYCLKQEGVYVYMDMMTYRKFKEGDDVPQYELLPDLGRPWSMTNRHLIDLQKEFMEQIWTHVNPYTGLAYKDEPAIVLTEIINETDLFINTAGKRKDYVEPTYYTSEFRRMFKAWLEEKGIDYDWEHCDLYANDLPLLQFKVHASKAYFKEMYDYMRSLGVKIPITGTNWSKLHPGLAMSHEEMDFSDNHIYFYDWKWANQERICANVPISGAPMVAPNLGRMDLAGKPFFISEWDMPWPNSYRAEGPIYFAALGCLQGWTGYTIHTYAYSSHLENMQVLGRELSTPVAGVPYREGIFSTWNDPAKFGMFYHAALMTRRCDVTPANKKVAVSYPDLDKSSNLAFQNLLDRHRAGVVFGETIPEGYDELIHHDEKYPVEGGSLIVSDNGQVWRDTAKKVGAIDTPRTKCVYGSIATNTHGNSNFTQKLNGIALEGMEVVGRTDFGVIALSSLSNAPIEESDNMLLTTIGRARNTDACFDGEKMLDVGKPPIMCEVIQATIRIKTKHGNSLKVWGVNAEGFYSGDHATTYEDGWLQFEVGDIDNPACYYLIVKE